MKKALKIGGLVILIAILAVVGFFGFILFGSNTYRTSDIAYYRAISGETDGPNSLAILGQQIDIPDCPYTLPYIDALAPYEDYRFNYTARRMSIFESHAYILIVEYDAAEYGKRKAELDEVYTWLREGIPGEEEDVSPEFTLDGFQFRTAFGGKYPKEMLFIGTCDDKQEIAYIYFWDHDLDYVGPSVEDYLKDETGWRKVVK